MKYSVRHSFEENCPDEENDQDDVGVEGGDPDDKGTLCYALDDALKVISHLNETNATIRLGYFGRSCQQILFQRQPLGYNLKRHFLRKNCCGYFSANY